MLAGLLVGWMHLHREFLLRVDELQNRTGKLAVDWEAWPSPRRSEPEPGYEFAERLPGERSIADAALRAIDIGEQPRLTGGLVAGRAIQKRSQPGCCPRSMVLKIGSKRSG